MHGCTRGRPRTSAPPEKVPARVRELRWDSCALCSLTSHLLAGGIPDAGCSEVSVGAATLCRQEGEPAPGWAVGCRQLEQEAAAWHQVAAVARAGVSQRVFTEEGGGEGASI